MAAVVILKEESSPEQLSQQSVKEGVLKSKYMRQQKVVRWEGIETEWSICEVPRSMVSDLFGVLSELKGFLKSHGRGKKASLTAIIVVQHTQYDCLQRASHIQRERDECLARFARMAKWMVDRTSDLKEFCDAIDPCTGAALIGRSGPGIYDEIDGCGRLLGYGDCRFGCCGVLSHPRWGTHIYPSTLFTSLMDVPELILRLNEFFCDSNE